MPKIPKVKIPEDAQVLYGTPIGKGTRYGSSFMSWHETEKKARSVAAGYSGDGSGKIRKVTTWKEHFVDEGKQLTVEHSLEEVLPDVTEFNEYGQRNHDNYIKYRDCKHKETRTHKSGAGCNTWIDTTCTSCGRAVA